MKKHVLMFALLFASLISITPAIAAGKTSTATSADIVLLNPTQNIPIVGSFVNGNVIGSLVGTFDIFQFVQRGSQIVAIGAITGTLTDVAGNIVGTVAGTQVELPISQLIGGGDLLHLELGASDINLLGIMVHTDQVGVDISNESGVLGSLLTTITGLLGSPLLLFLVVGLLNTVLGLLG